MKIRGGHIGYGISRPFRKKGLASFALASILEFAKQRGMKDILMTCDEDNIGSIRVIEKNGGILIDKVIAPGRTVVTNRYQITL
jgi:predicted acetyltransferase